MSQRVEEPGPSLDTARVRQHLHTEATGPTDELLPELTVEQMHVLAHLRDATLGSTERLVWLTDMFEHPEVAASGPVEARRFVLATVAFLCDAAEAHLVVKDAQGSWELLRTPTALGAVSRLARSLDGLGRQPLRGEIGAIVPTPQVIAVPRQR